MVWVPAEIVVVSGVSPRSSASMTTVAPVGCERMTICPAVGAPVLSPAISQAITPASINATAAIAPSGVVIHPAPPRITRAATGSDVAPISSGVCTSGATASTGGQANSGADSNSEVDPDSGTVPAAACGGSAGDGAGCGTGTRAGSVVSGAVGRVGAT